MQLAKLLLTRRMTSVEEYLDIDNDGNIEHENDGDDWEDKRMAPVIAIMMTSTKPLIFALQSVIQKLRNTPKNSNCFVGKMTFPSRIYCC